ncbi:MAG: hypothetical protein ACREA0_25305, partial [bacterium]
MPQSPLAVSPLGKNADGGWLGSPTWIVPRSSLLTGREVLREWLSGWLRNSNPGVEGAGAVVHADPICGGTVSKNLA